jgi:hypothetical protein
VVPLDDRAETPATARPGDVTLEIAQLLALPAVLLASIAASIVVALHVSRSNVDPLVDGVSAYALGSLGRWYRIQVVATGLAALLLALALGVEGLASGIAIGWLVAFGISRILISRYPTDPHGTTVFSRAGRLHIVLATVTFVTIAVAAPLIGNDLAGHPEWTGPIDLLTILGWSTTVFALGTFASSTTPATRRIFGLVERGVYAGMLAWLVVAAVGIGGLAG